jgi:hypothetical protein
VRLRAVRRVAPFVAAVLLTSAALVLAGCGRAPASSRRAPAATPAAGAAFTPAVGAQGWDHPCAPVQEPSPPYAKYESVWTALVFDGADLPFYGMYAYFWVDRFLYEGCAYTDTVAGFFLKDGGPLDNAFGDGVFSGYPIEYLSPTYFDMRVYPFLRATRDATDLKHYRLEATGLDFHGVFDIECHSVYEWTDDYFSYYNAELTAADVTFRGQRYTFTGLGAFERWWDRGGWDPVGFDRIDGWSLYADMHWDDGQGGRLDTLAWPRYYLGDGAPAAWMHGEIDENGVATAIVGGTVDFDFPENRGVAGWMQKYRLTAELADGRQLQYVAQVVREYRDEHPAMWQTPASANFRESHSYAEGTLTLDGVAYAGRGEHEWQLTHDSPLPQ